MDAPPHFTGEETYGTPVVWAACHGRQTSPLRKAAAFVMMLNKCYNCFCYLFVIILFIGIKC